MSDKPSDPQSAKFAWRELPARHLPRRSASERAADFLEIYGPYNEATAREQASRCVQCPNPTCVQGCPLCNPIPEWMLLTAEGKFLEAAAVIGSMTNMPEICSRLCPSDHLCEAQCILDAVSDPVPIRSLEQFLIDHAFARGAVDASASPPNGFRVAIAGSGAAALTCADELSRRGYSVEVFDSGLVPGGLLVNGTPSFDLDGSIVQRRIELLQQRGVKFNLGAELWTKPSLEDLAKGYDAVFLGLDAREARPLQIPGADLKGVVQAVAFLLQKSTAVELDAPRIDLHDQRVAIIGGGDTAIECARAAVRYSASTVTCFYRRTEGQMPGRRSKYQEAVEEGVQFIFQAVPVEVIGRDGSATGLRLVRTSPEAIAQPGTEFEIEADWVIPALGFNPACCPDETGFEVLKKNSWGGLDVNDRQMTSRPGVFAAGDLVRGPSPLLETVRDARKAAEGIDAYLGARAKK